MIMFFSWFLIPFLTMFMAGSEGLFSSNFSVAASEAPGRYLLILWAIVTGGYFRFLIRRSIGQAAPFLAANREPVLTDTAVCLLFVSVLFPYRPEQSPFFSAVHVVCAFCSSVLYFTVLLILDLRLYFHDPQRFSGLTAALLFSIFVAAALFLLSDFLITSALEIFVTVFSSAWLHVFYRRTAALRNRRETDSRKGQP